MAEGGQLVLGTAALGLAYGLPVAGAKSAALPSEAAAADVIGSAERAGFHAFDTAPSYGLSEERLGRALEGRGQIWTKVGTERPPDGSLPFAAVASLEASLARLRRRRVDLLQWHNWTPAIAEGADFAVACRDLLRHPAVGALGASTYGGENAQASVSSGLFDVVQVEWNLLNQSVLRRLRGLSLGRTRLALRSVFLQGVLTDRGATLPDHLQALEPAVQRARALAARWQMDLSSLALRAALDQPFKTWVVVGASTAAEVERALEVARRGPLTEGQLQEIEGLDQSHLPLVDPRSWPSP